MNANSGAPFLLLTQNNSCNWASQTSVPVLLRQHVQLSACMCDSVLVAISDISTSLAKVTDDTDALY